MGIETILMTVLPAFFPAVMDGVKGGMAKLFGYNMGDPKTFDDFMRLRDQDNRKLELLAKLDNPTGQVSQWVADLRGSTRYIAAMAIIAAAVFLMIWPQPALNEAKLDMLNQLASSTFFFLFGDRVYLGLKGQK